MYNPIMTNAIQLQRLTDKLWDDYCEIFPRLVRFDSPKIVINNRFTKCAGMNRTELNQIDLGGKFLAQFPDNMTRVILPHEIAHQIDFNLNGWYDRKPHHGKQWIEIMVRIGQNPNPYHSMVLKK
jgi:predicted SprT family Zn-dependent metalloprotease